jgi:hypothetical protein
LNEDHHAISGYVFLVNGGAVSWSLKHQEIISLSMTKSKYVAATHAAKEAIWLRTFLGEVLILFTCLITLFCNNQLAIALARDLQFHTCMKHIDIHYHFIRGAVKDLKISIVYCPTDDMATDALTKPLPVPKVSKFAKMFRLQVA